MDPNQFQIVNSYVINVRGLGFRPLEKSRELVFRLRTLVNDVHHPIEVLKDLLGQPMFVD
jgi:hypothetical protein